MARILFSFTVGSCFVAVSAVSSLAQEQTNENVEILSNWGYDPLYAEGWSVGDMFAMTDVVDVNGEEIGNVENVVFSNDGEVLGIIAEVGGFWDIADTHVFVPWDEVTVEAGIQQVQVPVTEETIDDYDVFGGNWFDEEIITQTDTEAIQAVDDDLIAGAGVFKATDLIGDYTYLQDNVRYGYVADIIVQERALSALVVDAGAYGRRGYYAFPYAYRGDMNFPRYDLPYDPGQVDTIENFDYERLQSRAPS